MKGLLVSMASVVAAGLVLSGCAQPAPPPAPTQAPAAPPRAAEPVKAPAAPTAAPAAAPASAPTAAPAAAPAAQPAAAPAPKVDFPQKGKAITIIVPWAAGGATDIGARLMASGLEKELGTSVQVVNRDAAGSQVGVTEVAKAKPDGYTVGLTNLPTTITLYLDPERKAAFARGDLMQVGAYDYDPVVIAAKGDGRFKTLKDLLDEAKAKPGKVTVATTGLMGVTHLPLLQLQQMAGVELAIVEMSGTTQQSTAMLGDNVDSGSGSAGNWPAMWKSGQLRYLTIHDSQESKLFPGVKTTESQGYKLYASTVHGLSMPGGTPKEIVDILSAAVKKVTESDQFRSKMQELSFSVRYLDAAQHTALWDQTEKDVAPLVKQIREGQKK